MADAEWRELERRSEAAPDDRDLLERAILARRRAGLPVPRRLLDRRLRPPRTFASRLVPSRVWVERHDGRVEAVGRTPRLWPLEVPEHRRWWVELLGRATPAAVARLAEEVRAQEVPGVALSNPSDAALAALEELGALEELRVAGAPDLTDADLRSVGRLPRLRRFALDGGLRVSAAGLAHLRSLASLEVLALVGPTVADEEARILGELRGLTELGVGVTRITGEGLAHLGRLAALSSLDLDAAPRLRDEHLEGLTGLSELVRLNLVGSPRLTADGLRRLAALPRLELLIVGRGVDADGLDALWSAFGGRCVVRRTWDASAWGYYPWNAPA